ncbi:MAG: CatB-related O-acetyltransferase [Halobacteriota archaeon]
MLSKVLPRPAKKEHFTTKQRFTKDYFLEHPFRDHIHIGDYTYGFPNIELSTGRYHVHIGKFCSIAYGANILVDVDHPTKWVTTYPLGHYIDSIARKESFLESKGDIHIGNDVWIGVNSVILSGITVGDGAVIGAGAIVTKHVSDYEIVGGNPAKSIKFRFEPPQIKALKQIEWWNWPLTKIEENSHLLQSPEVDEFIMKFLDQRH